MNATTAALIVISLMLLTNVVTWDDITKNSAAWNTLAWFATLVALADGLTRVGFVKWFAQTVATHTERLYAAEGGRGAAADQFFRPLPVCQRYGACYGHDSGAARGRLDDSRTSTCTRSLLGLCLQLGIMGIITPYGSGPSPVYYGSGYLPAADYWRLGAIFGLIFFVVFMLTSVPWVLVRG